MRIYVDTNIIMDFLLDRQSSAYKIFTRALHCEFSLVISHVVLEELRFQGLFFETENFVRIFTSCKKITVLEVLSEDKEKAKNIIRSKNTHYNDALHKVIACRANVDGIVTRNIKDFACFDDIAIWRPDDI